MATHPSTLAWKIPRTEEPGRLQSLGSRRVGMTKQLHFQFSMSCTGEGNGNPLQCSCLENPRDGGAWGSAICGSHRVGHDWSDVAAAAAAEKRDIPVIPEPWQRDRALLWGLWRSSEGWAAGSSCVSKKRIGNDGESAVLRVKNPGGVVVVCVILCVCLDGLFFSEKSNRRWCSRNSTHPPPPFFFVFF